MVHYISFRASVSSFFRLFSECSLFEGNCLKLMPNVVHVNSLTQLLYFQFNAVNESSIPTAVWHCNHPLTQNWELPTFKGLIQQNAETSNRRSTF